MNNFVFDPRSYSHNTNHCTEMLRSIFAEEKHFYFDSDDIIMETKKKHYEMKIKDPSSNTKPPQSINVSITTP